MLQFHVPRIGMIIDKRKVKVEGVALSSVKSKVELSGKGFESWVVGK